MKIAFDVDGVFTDLETFLLNKGGRYFSLPVLQQPYDATPEGLFGCTPTQSHRFWKKYLLFYVLFTPPRQGLAKFMKKLYTYSDEIYIITSRVFCKENSVLGRFMRLLIKRWIKKYVGDVDRIEFCSVENSAAEKSQVCLELGVDVMVEDSPANIQALCACTQVVCFDATYNRQCTPAGISRVKTYGELLQLLEKLREEKNRIYIIPFTQRQTLNQKQKQGYYASLRTYYKRTANTSRYERWAKQYCRVFTFLSPVFGLCFPSTAIGAIPPPVATGYIFVANHRDFSDVPLVLYTVGGRPVHTLCKYELLETSLGRLLQYMGSVFVQRENPYSRGASKDQLCRLLLSGHHVLICPEGTRNKTLAPLLPFQLGAVSVAQTTGAPIVPLAIQKNQNNWRKGINVHIGTPLYIKMEDDLLAANEELRNWFLEQMA